MPDPTDQQRDAMVANQIEGRGITNPRILEAMRRVPRHRFMPQRVQHLAYQDRPLPIGHGQTISQPYMVGLMTHLLDPQPDDIVLEIGVGSGYQTAILAELAAEVIGVERITPLAERAARLLADLGYTNTTVLVGDGTMGLPDRSPYDGILVAAAGPHLPRPLLDQLADEGRLVIPVGEGRKQTLIRAVRRGGSLHIERLTSVRFVPLIGKHGAGGDAQI
ncbi:MAG: protein-L-isoaspartate(D-aspartate) O-methyltransferase [Chloroflexi bacterium]|nr:protein-L-isoaspartate(D-aspartate) O-methyltransferase [Chloroflexota bacterium]